MKSKEQLAEEYCNSLFPDIKEYSRESYAIIIKRRHATNSFIAGYDKALECAIEQLKEIMEMCHYDMNRAQTERCINELIDIKQTKN